VLTCGNDLLAQDSVRKRLEALRAELRGPGPISPLEDLLVAHVVACWQQLQYCDAAAAALQGTTLAQARFAIERQSRARRSYLQAMMALATVRRLLPAAQPIEPVASLPGGTDTAFEPNEHGAGASCPDHGRPTAAGQGPDIGDAVGAVEGILLPLEAARSHAPPAQGQARSTRRKARD
jgi:hypothetical protein